MTPDPPRFAELVAATNFSFLDGASHGEDMVGQAVALELDGLGIADRNTVAGVVRAHKAIRQAREGAAAIGAPELPFRLVVGARLVFADGTQDIVAYPATRAGWARLTRLLTAGNLRARKGGCILGIGDLMRHLDDLLLIVLPQSSARPVEPMPDVMLPPPRADPALAQTLRLLRDATPGSLWLGITMPRAGSDRRRLMRLARLAGSMGIPLLATSDALYAEPGDRPLHDVLTCIRDGITIQHAGRRLAANAERHLKPASEMARLFVDQPQALTESLAILDRIDFTLDQLSYEYPHEPVPDGWSAQGWLEHITYQAAHARFPDGIPAKLHRLLNEELPLIAKRQYAHYFLTVHDIVHFAREQCTPPILCQGRGSAANSAVCWLLGVTSVDPMKHDLLFSRFVSSKRDEPPDIDIDFEHERREEVMQYIYRRYGRHRAAIAATVIHYRPKSAVREAGKALGLTEDVTQRLTSTVWGSFADHFEERRFKETGFDLDNPEIVRLRASVDALLRFPRHLSQHVGGFVLTQGRLDETVPIHNGAMDNRTFIEWDKDDIDELKIMKVDILALGMLTCIRKAFDLMEHHGLGRHELNDIAVDEDPRVYAMLQKGDSIGVFQVESRAQINMLPRLRPKELYDLVIQVAIVRPGPIEGDMVHPYLRRRSGKEAVIYPSPHPDHGPADELEQLLGKTFGVPLFQEQAMKLAIVAAKFTPEEANLLRKAMQTFKRTEGIQNFEAKLVEGMVDRGYPRDFAERCYKQIEGFGSYGFPESHALSFARLVYVSSWIKCFHPAVFACAILNSQPMGFYAPAQLVRDAIQHGVKVQPVDVNASAWDNRLEDFALRLGFRQIDGFRESWATQIVAHAPYAAIEDLAARADLPQRALTLLADADAYRSLGCDRRHGLWEARRTPPRQLPLFAAMDAPELAPEPDAKLPSMPLSEQVANDYRATRLSLKGHPMAFLRPLFAAEGILSCRDTEAMRDGARARVAGVVLVRQRPGKGNAIFVTVEDETGIVNALMWARDFEANRRAVMAARLMVLHGVIQRSEEGVIHLMTVRVDDRSDELARLSDARADGLLRPVHTRSPDPRAGHPRDARLLPKSRDFH
ncbi:error-prone DNA polymerase [uncultured Sphingomonas sp.]|uniref:error-prone DNA polymerase n=1 Tax=uncultured Sphingomonas sp. TaxID=158754 RepID=UPI00260EFA9F|nr:error-prone DNA polymerase [uncultured Sphingomonas sp.]